MILILLLISILLNVLGGKLIPKNKSEIVDTGHSILPKIPSTVPDIMLVITLLITAFSYKKITNHALIVLSFMFFFRFITTVSTILPVPKGEKKCTPSDLPLNYCNDYIFSGHASTIIVLSYFIGKPLWPIWPIISSLCIIASRQHYTVDVQIAWILFFSIIGKF